MTLDMPARPSACTCQAFQLVTSYCSQYLKLWLFLFLHYLTAAPDPGWLHGEPNAFKNRAVPTFQPGIGLPIAYRKLHPILNCVPGSDVFWNILNVNLTTPDVLKVLH